jgi:hypothetical protein
MIWLSGCCCAHLDECRLLLLLLGLLGLEGTHQHSPKHLHVSIVITAAAAAAGKQQHQQQGNSRMVQQVARHEHAYAVPYDLALDATTNNNTTTTKPFAKLTLTVVQSIN